MTSAAHGRRRSPRLDPCQRQVASMPAVMVRRATNPRQRDVVALQRLKHARAPVHRDGRLRGIHARQADPAVLQPFLQLRVGMDDGQHHLRGVLHHEQDPDRLVDLHHLPRQPRPQVPLHPVHHPDEARHVVRQLRPAPQHLVVHRREVVLEADAAADGDDRAQDVAEEPRRRVGYVVVGNEEGPAVQEQPARRVPSSHEGDGVRGVAVLWPRLAQVLRSLHHVAQLLSITLAHSEWMQIFLWLFLK